MEESLQELFKLRDAVDICLKHRASGVLDAIKEDVEEKIKQKEAQHEV